MPKVFLTARQRREDAFRSAIKAYVFEEDTTKKELAEKANPACDDQRQSLIKTQKRQ